MVTIVFETHSTTTHNEAGVASGMNDPDLSDLGRQQAKQLGGRYRGRNFDVIFCSDLKRSRQTAEMAFGHKNPKIVIDHRLRECDYGNLNGAEKAVVDKAKIKYIDKPFPKGQSYAQTTQLMGQFLNELLHEYRDAEVLIIGSRATQYALENLINKVPLAEAVGAPWHWQPGWTYKLEKL